MASYSRHRQINFPIFYDDVSLDKLSFQVATSIILTIYTQTVFEVIGYEWTFVIFGIFATLGEHSFLT